MHRIKRTLVWLMVAVLLGSAFPASFFKQADAASAATYFIPDLKALRDTAFVDPAAASTSTNPLPLTRDNVYQTSSGLLTITGTYSYVTSNSMSVKVEQLSSVGGTWTTDSTHVTTSTVTADTGSTNRFTASNLPLFSGFNKITFSGLQGSVNRSDVFYVLYDSVPYMKSLKVNGGTGGSINLNEGTQVVLDTDNVTLQGVVQNATKVTMSLNGGSPTITSLLDDGTFFTPSVTLNAGINTVTLVVSNSSDSITVSRILYYYDKDHPFTKLNYVVGPSSGTTSYSLLNGNIPIVTVDASTAGYVSKLQVQLLVPYDSVPFAGNGQYSLNGSGTYTTVTTTTSDVVITGSDGVTPVYRLVGFDIPYTVNTLTVDQPANVAIKYGSATTFLAAQTGKFKYLPNDVVIKNLYYLPDLKPSTSSPVSIADANKVPLDGAEVNESDFYILVETDKAPSAANPLTGTYVPGSTPVNLTQVTSGVTIPSGTFQYVYKVTGFASGQQTVKFQYTNSTASKSADISYASQSYIYIANLYDGQTYTFNSKLSTNSLTVQGQFIGFKGWATSATTATNDNIQMFINGTVLKNSSGVELKPTLTPVSGRDDAYSFSYTLNITEAGPLIYGQNRIKFTGTKTDAAGNIQVVSKEIRINIIDENVSTISKFYPVMVPIDGREPFTDFLFDTNNYPDDKLAKIFTTSPEFLYADSKYTTSQESYDLVVRGGGAKHLNLYYGSDLFGHIDLSTVTANNGSFTYGGVNYPYHIALSADQSEFILRVEGLTFEQPGSMVFNLELINETGARSTQKLEVVREVASYRLLAPQPTVGDQIIVNKNFVRFDIEAEGATQVLIGKDQATKRSDYEDRFFFDYVGLKANKDNVINIQVVRDGSTFKDTVHVFYTDSVQVDSEYMETLKTKHTVFNKQLQLSFPKGTVLKSSGTTSTAVTKFYTDMKLLFAIADDSGIVERKNDYGNVIGTLDARSEKGQYQIYVPDYLVSNFQSTANTSNFSRVSELYWISGGVGESGDKGTTGYQPAMNGIAPYAINPYATSGDRTLKFTEIPSNRKVVPSNRGELTLAFDPNIVDAAETTITVFRYTDAGKWVNVGGEADMKNHTITVPFDDFGYYTVMKMRKGFSDITNHTWARNILNALYAKGIMNATQPPNVFGADDETTRGEFATLIVKGMSLPINSDDTQTFYDVLPGVSTATWSYDYIETAARAGIVNGITEGFFNPEGKLTREEAAVMIARALKLKLATNDSKLETALAKSFLDSTSIQYYARPAIQAVSKAKVMSGSPVDVQGKTQYNFNPKGKLTRAEAGKIAVALFQKNTKLFPSNLS